MPPSVARNIAFPRSTRNGSISVSASIKLADGTLRHCRCQAVFFGTIPHGKIPQIVELNPELPALEVGVDDEHTIDDEIRPRDHVGVEAIETRIGGGRIAGATNTALEQAPVKHDLALTVRIFDPIRPIPLNWGQQLS